MCAVPTQMFPRVENETRDYARSVITIAGDLYWTASAEAEFTCARSDGLS